MTSPGVGRPLSFHVGRIFVILSAITLVLSMTMAPAAFGDHNDNHNPPGQQDNPGQGNKPDTPPGQDKDNVGGGGKAEKVWVCKYERTPQGVIELRQGKNPILVSGNAAKDGDFSDRHISEVIGSESDFSTPPTAADCLLTQQPNQVYVCPPTGSSPILVDFADLDGRTVVSENTTCNVIQGGDDPDPVLTEIDEEEEAEIQAPDEEDVLGDEEVLEDEVLEEEEEVQQEEQTITELPRTGPESAPLFALIASLLMGAGGALLMLTSRRTTGLDLI